MAIPNVFHFAFGFQSDFGGKPFGLVHYLAIKSACEVNSLLPPTFIASTSQKGFGSSRRPRTSLTFPSSLPSKFSAVLFVITPIRQTYFA
jgi:hypothetical protein